MSIQKGIRVSKSERYIALVEFIRSKNLLMRTLINDVELLIIASTTLSSDSQRGSNKMIDVEIDMIVGEDVETVDIVLHSWS
ncbi:hypothetical protein KY284_030146 [Solanum tuberosum]|nr:hypothetical protein KY284_030146 [Solanum tuberosum]